MMRTSIVVALALLISACAGGDINPPKMPEVQPQQSAAYVNQIVNPDLPAAVYRDCMAGAWNGGANAGSSGKGHHIDATQRCAETPTRKGGQRFHGVMVSPNAGATP